MTDSVTLLLQQIAAAKELPAGYLRCEQRAGDVIYVPQQWWHSTLNIQESVGLAQQMGARRGLFEVHMGGHFAKDR